jgi:6-phosphogluconolactonase
VQEEKPGQVATFAIDTDGNALTPLSSTSAGGDEPCFLALDASGQYLLGANYGSGNVSVHRLTADGIAGEFGDLVPLADAAADAHAHMVLPVPFSDTILTVDLGTDTISTYTLDLTTGRLSLLAAGRLRTGTGPRHVAFHPSGAFFYLANEYDNSVSVCSYDAACGEVKELAVHEAAPMPDGERSYPGGIVISPDGRHVYVANRGHESITAFAVIDDGADLRPAGRWGSGGSWPRHLTFAPDGRFLFCANQRAGSVTAFQVDPAEGRLTAIGAAISLPFPAHVLVG